MTDTNGINGRVTVNEANATDISDKRSSYDVLIVGGGFSGIYALYRMRQLNLRARIFEKGRELGGTWHWNRYPGCRVDSECIFYQLNIPEVWKSWTWSQRFPSSGEIRQYLKHIDETLGVRKDSEFGFHVIEGWHGDDGLWAIRAKDGRIARGKYLIAAGGPLSIPFSPDHVGMASFEGTLLHSSNWSSTLSLKDKRVAVIGTGSTGVQLIEAAAKEASSLTVYMRRPPYAIPMKQRELGKDEQENLKPYYPALFREGRLSGSGFPAITAPKLALNSTTEERQEWFEWLWQHGGFNFVTGQYPDFIVDEEANRYVYEFWRSKVLPRIKSPSKRELLAPEKQPYFWGTKRWQLEQDFYECVSQENVEIVSLHETPIKAFKKEGIDTADGKSRNFDVVIMATGFDALHSTITSMGIKRKDGTPLQNVWKDRVASHLGLTINGFPNMFIVNNTLTPNVLTNVITSTETSVDLIITVISKLNDEGLTTVESTGEADISWSQIVEASGQATLIDRTESWWTGENIPGKAKQLVTFMPGIREWERLSREKIATWDGFMVR